jgi:hypothetical protein
MKTSSESSASAPYRAKYLVLLHTQPHQRAFLFNGESDFLAELDDDGFVVDNLVRAGTPCQPPPSLPLPTLDADSQLGPADRLECYSLG